MKNVKMPGVNKSSVSTEKTQGDPPFVKKDF